MSGLACEKLLFRAVRFLEGVGSVIEEHPQIALSDWSWGSFEENGTEVRGGLFRLQAERQERDFLYVMIVLTEMVRGMATPYGSRPTRRTCGTRSKPPLKAKT